VNTCAKCGACSVVCPVYQESGREAHTARGKHHLAEVIDQEKIGPVYEELFSQCLLCGRCKEVCVREIDTPLAVVQARSNFSTFYGEHGYTKFLARKLLNHPSLFHSLAALGRKTADMLAASLPRESGLRLKLGLFQQKRRMSHHEVLPKHPVSVTSRETITYYPGCVSSYLYPRIIQDMSGILAQTGFVLFLPEGLGCCGLAAWAAGDIDGARQLAKQNITALERTKGEIVVSCGSCFHQLRKYAELFDDPDWSRRAEKVGLRLRMVSQFLVCYPLPQSRPSDQSAKKIRLFYHDPCHLLTGERVVDEPREVLARIPSIELVELEDGPRCCGHGGLFSLGAPELSEKIRKKLVDKILQLQPDIITTSCSGCLMQLRMGIMAAGSEIEVLDFSELMAAIAGGNEVLNGSVE